MTPLHLEILMNYFVRPTDCELIDSNLTWALYAYDLAKLGLLYSPQKTEEKIPLFAITEHGKKKVAEILACLGDKEAVFKEVEHD